MTLKQRLISKQARVGVIGLGYVGLPLVAEIAGAGFKTLGIDIKNARVAQINEGESYISDVKSETITELVKKGRLSATTDFSLVKDLDVIIVCVPTPLTETKEPDVSYVVGTAKTLSKHLTKEQLIVFESTTYPGTTKEVVLPLLEEGGLKGGQDFYLAYSPERVDPGNKKYTIKNTPKVVGGINEESTKVAELFYTQFVDRVIPVSSTQVAEMTKLLENVFRCVNIALVNELMLLCDRMGIDVWEVVEAASTKPFGFMRFLPGPGLGGHCIPIDPFYLSWKAKQYGFQTEFIELAGKTNENMPYYVVSKVFEALNDHQKSIKGSSILLLGVAYKKDIGDVRESPALKVMSLLLKRGAKVDYHDPFVSEVEVDGHKFSSFPLESSLLKKSDCIVILTDHSQVDYSFLVANSKLIVDTRNVLADFGDESIVKI